MIRIQELEKSFRLQGQTLPILKIDEWSVAPKERVALIGPSGSGKSTLLHIIGGVIPADQGEVVIDGHPIAAWQESKRDAFRARHIGYIFQDFHLIPSLTARQNVELVLDGSRKPSSRKSLIDDWFERVGLLDRMNHLPSELSRGQQQRVAMIRALINRPPVVLADEPTGSLDWETASSVMELLLSLCAQERLTLLTVTHDLHLAQQFPRIVNMTDINLLIAAKPQGSGRAAV
ncbi:ABC transporter ATP-binding protein [Paenibacillus filicis]|uniref:ABC transporter ATP-binding protein n=1 Tax=Paenibacillus filicis TaxID=669464 RepID=A0ABU9DC39_9BACL